MGRRSVSLEYGKSFRRALRKVCMLQLRDGSVDLDSSAAEELFERAEPVDVINALLETVAILVSEDVDGRPEERIEQAVARLGKRRLTKSKR